MMWIILFTNVILLFRNVILQTKTIILLSTKIISLAKIIQNKITLKSTLHSLTFNFAPVLFTNRKSDFLQCISDNQHPLWMITLLEVRRQKLNRDTCIVNSSEKWFQMKKKVVFRGLLWEAALAITKGFQIWHSRYCRSF